MRPAGNHPRNGADSAAGGLPAACAGILVAAALGALIVFYALAALVMMRNLAG